MDRKFTEQPQWTIADSLDLYQVPAWSEGYFDINDAGHVVARPDRDNGQSIDLFELARDLKQKGLAPPILLRFSNILHQRIDSMCQAFKQAMDEYRYQSSYTAVYPIKVNQQRKVVEDIIQHGQDRIGLEAGSKPELLTIIALSRMGNTVICNGYKDLEYIRIALIGQELGLRVFIVIEKLSELKLIINTAKEMGIRPHLGVRVRLSSVAEGNWQNTGGEKSKFGLHSAQVILAIEQLESADMLDCLQLLHFHIGSQVSNIQHFQRALHEGSRFFSELRAMHAPITCVDVGGGLGVDYEGSQSKNFCSVNYSIQAYADTVVHAFASICEQHTLPQPEIITESGRAMTAHHAMLITNVIGIEQMPGLVKPEAAKRNEVETIRSLWKVLQSIKKKNAVQSYHDALHYFDEAKEMFVHGLLNLQQRARTETLFYAICRKVQGLLKADQREMLDELNGRLADKYFCNFSLFQSLPDSWAIGQIFPVMPLHRLGECPDKHAMIEDLTCDSDGMINLYVDKQGISSSLPIHAPGVDEPYLLGIFMLGAYQEILGDMHNLFGDTASVNVELVPGGEYRLTEIHKGDAVADLLDYVHISGKTLEHCYKQKIYAADLDKNLQLQYLQELSQGLDGYTYLED